MSNSAIDRINAIKARFAKTTNLIKPPQDENIKAIVENIYKENLAIAEVEDVKSLAASNFDSSKCLTAEELAEIEEEVFEDFTIDEIIDDEVVVVVKEYGVKNGMD